MEKEANNPSPLLRWLADFGKRREAIGQAIRDFAALLSQMPDPQSAAEVEALLHWRGQLRLADVPANHDRIGEASELIPRAIKHNLHDVRQAMQRLLESIEDALTYDACHNRNGLFSPAACPRQAIVVSGGHAILTTLLALPPDHPLRAVLDHEERLPWIDLGPARSEHMGGIERHVPPAWRTVASIVAEVEEARREKDEKDRQAAQVAEIYRHRAEVEEALRRSPEERLRRRVIEMEKELAALKGQRGTQETPNKEEATCE